VGVGADPGRQESLPLFVGLSGSVPRTDSSRHFRNSETDLRRLRDQVSFGEGADRSAAVLGPRFQFLQSQQVGFVLC